MFMKYTNTDIILLPYTSSKQYTPALYNSTVPHNTPKVVIEY